MLGRTRQMSVESGSVTFSGQAVQMTGAQQDLRPTIERHMRSLAVIELPRRMFHFAQQHGLKVDACHSAESKVALGFLLATWDEFHKTGV
jgi:hypothetical protein